MVDSRVTPRAPSDPQAVRTLPSTERIRLTDQLLREAHATVNEPARCALLERVSLLNRSVAEAVAKRYRGRGVPVEALYQAAFEGLVDAVGTFDPTVDADLLTYAVPR